MTERIIKEMKRDLGHLRFNDMIDMLIHSLTEEAGEVAGLRKRELKGIAVPQTKYIEELGDLWWYLVNTIEIIGSSLEEVDQYNKKKLEMRYSHDGQTVQDNR